MKLTARVPKIAPLAPTEGTPTREKLPPRMFLGTACEQATPTLKRHEAYPNIPEAK